MIVYGLRGSAVAQSGCSTRRPQLKPWHVDPTNSMRHRAMQRSRNRWSSSDSRRPRPKGVSPLHVLSNNVGTELANTCQALLCGTHWHDNEAQRRSMTIPQQCPRDATYGTSIEFRSHLPLTLVLLRCAFIVGCGANSSGHASVQTGSIEVQDAARGSTPADMGSRSDTGDAGRDTSATSEPDASTPASCDELEQTASAAQAAALVGASDDSCEQDEDCTRTASVRCLQCGFPFVLPKRDLSKLSAQIEVLERRSA